MLTLDEYGHPIRVPDEEENLTESEKKEKLYAINTSIPLVPDGNSYKEGAKININCPYATVDTPINIDISYIRGYKISKVDVLLDTADGGSYMPEENYTLQDGMGMRTKVLSFIMPMSNVDINIQIEKE